MSAFAELRAALDVIDWWRSAWLDHFGVAYEALSDFADLEALTRLIDMRGDVYATQHLLQIELKQWDGMKSGFNALETICKRYKRQDFKSHDEPMLDGVSDAN